MESNLTFCESCLTKISSKLSLEEMEILNILIKEKAISETMSISKKKIIESGGRLSDYKFQISIAKMELVGLVGRNFSKRPNQFFIEDNGLFVFNSYKKQLANNLKKVK